MVTDPKPGDRVRANQDLWQEANDCHPLSLYAAKGDVLVIRSIVSGGCDPRMVLGRYLLNVSHESITDRQFGASHEELDPLLSRPGRGKENVS